MNPPLFWYTNWNYQKCGDAPPMSFQEFLAETNDLPKLMKASWYVPFKEAKEKFEKTFAPFAQPTLTSPDHFQKKVDQSKTASESRKIQKARE